MKMKLGKQEMQMLAYLQMRKYQTVKTGELTDPLQLSREQERELFRRISGERTIGAVALTSIKVANKRLGETEEMQTVENQTAVYGSRVRTLVDAVYDWSRFNSLPRAYDWIRGELAAGRVSATELVAVALRYGDKGTIRRIGALLEMQGVEAGLLRKFEKVLNPSTGLIPWIPTKPKRGKINRRCGLC